MAPQDVRDESCSNKENNTLPPGTSAFAVLYSETPQSLQNNISSRHNILGLSRLANRNHPLDTSDPASDVVSSSKHTQQSFPVIRSSYSHTNISLGQTAELHCLSSDDWKDQEVYAPGASADEAERRNFTIPLGQNEEEAAQIGDADEVEEDHGQYFPRNGSLRIAVILIAMLVQP